MEQAKSPNDYFIHPLADVQTSEIGSGTKIWQFSVVLKGAKIGKECNLNCHTFVENDVVIGDFVTLKSGVFVWDGTRIGNHVFLGPNVSFVNNPHPRSKAYPEKHIGATLEDHVSIGAGAVLMGGITIGKFAMIGAGSVVTKNIPPFTLWFGNPAQHRGYVTKEGEVLTLELISKKTGRKHTFQNQEITPI